MATPSPADAIEKIAARALSTLADGRFGQKTRRQAVDRRRRRVAAAAGLAAAGLAPAWAQRAAVPAAPASVPALAWPAAPAALAAAHRRAFAGLDARIAAEWPDVQSVALLHRGHLAYECYRNGLKPDTLPDTQSVTKSVLSLLFGQAVADGRVRGPDELVAMHLPQMLRLGADARVRQLRFRHLLTMTAGWPGDETARRDRDDDLRQLVRRPFVADPGQRFAYDNGAANLLALALAAAVGEPLADYAARRLFGPLGIDRLDWRRGAQGHALGARGLSLSTRAMARIGELVLAEGRWQGRPLVPADYLRAATTRRHPGGAPLGSAYGYLWWVGPARGPARPVAMANGYGGQWIYVEPALQAVAAVTARRTPQSAARGHALQLIRRALLPAVQKMK